MSRCKGQFVHIPPPPRIPPPENNCETEDDSSDESETDHETEENDSDNIDNPESNWQGTSINNLFFDSNAKDLSQFNNICTDNIRFDKQKYSTWNVSNMISKYV